MLIALTIFLGWLAYFLDFMLLIELKNDQSYDIAFTLYISRSLIFLCQATLIITTQMISEAELRSFGAKVSIENLEFWNSSLCQYIPHFLVSNGIRLFSEIFPFTIFLIAVIFYNADLFFAFSTIMFVIVGYLILSALIQSNISKRASQSVNEFVKNVALMNEVEREIYSHSKDNKNFLINNKSKIGKKFIFNNSISVSFAQTLRYQLEIIAVLALIIFLPDFEFDTPMVYLGYRIANTFFIVSGVFSSINHYSKFYFKMLNIESSVNFTGRSFLKLIFRK